MTPQLRKVLKSVSAKNQGLQEILKSCKEAIEVVSVDKTVYMVHNTRIVLKMPNDEQRVQFYNRVDIASFINTELDIPSDSAQAAITYLNSVQGCDFTVDDLEIVDGWLQAKASSLGYIGKVELPVTASDEIYIGMAMDYNKMEELIAAYGAMKVSADGVIATMENNILHSIFALDTYDAGVTVSAPGLHPLDDLPIPLPSTGIQGLPLNIVYKVSNITDKTVAAMWDLRDNNPTNAVVVMAFGNNGSIKVIDPLKAYSFKLLPATIPNNVFIAMYMDTSKAELSQAAFQGITLSIDGVKVGMQDSSIQLKLKEKTYVPSPPPNNPELKPLTDVPFPIPAPPKEGMVLLSVIQSSNITDARLNCQWDFSVGNESGVLAMVPFGDNPSIAFKGIEKQFSYKLTPLAPI